MPWWWYYVPLAVGTAATTVYSWRVPNAAMWIGLTALSFVLSSIWWAVGGGYPAFFGGSIDFLIALIMLLYAKTTWELWVLRIFGVMIFVNILWQFGAIPSHELYAITLEALNYAVLVFIAMMGTFKRAPTGGLHFRRGHAGWVGMAHRYLVGEARYPRWWRVAG
jgi:hypothetical protein